MTKNRSLTRRGCLSAALGAGMLLGASGSAQAQSLCVWDLLGTAGDGFALMRDYAVGVQKQVQFDLKAFPKEDEAIKAYLDGSCDALVATSFTTRQLNPVTGSLNAIGASTTPAVASTAVKMLLSPRFSNFMTVKGHEVVGIIPQGSAYLLVRDRSLNTLEKVHNKRFAAIDIDQAQQYMIHKIGAQPVPVGLADFAHAFNSGDVDVVASPAMAIQPLELYQGMGSTGGIIRFPVSYVTLDVVIHQDRFPAGFGAYSRNWFTTHMPRILRNVDRLEQGIKPQYWVNLSEADQAGYRKLMGEMRRDLVAEGIYNAQLLKIMERICSQTAGCKP